MAAERQNQMQENDLVSTEGGRLISHSESDAMTYHITCGTSAFQCTYTQP
jgi:hypothetical protein